jgi:2-hydroxychromene-2-carboxylate isomerase
MTKRIVRVYTDYISPYAHVANKPLFALEQSHDVELEWLPYSLDIADYMGSVENRSPHYWRKARYSYMDARRFANRQGLTLKGPKRVYDSYYSSVGMLFAQRHGFFRSYHDLVFTMFWNHELDVEDLDQMKAVIARIGGDPEAFAAYALGPARAEHERIIAEAEALGVFGVPTMVLDGELFWGGDRIPLLIERLDGIAPAAFSRRG